MGTIIINGRRMNYTGNGISGRDIIDIMKPEPGRRPVIRTHNMDFSQVKADKYYNEHELRDKYGAPVKVTTIPDRTKGIDFGMPRDDRSKSIIRDQVYDIAANCFKDGIDFDETNCDWMVAPQFHLPRIWSIRHAPLMILFPTAYPDIPPIGFYLASNVPSPNGHLFPQVSHGASPAPTMNGWKWYCSYVNPGAWRPAQVRQLSDWRKGDNIWTYMTLVNEVLAGHEA